MPITAAQYTYYPADFPGPRINGYSGSVDTGVIRSDGEGFPDQARGYESNPTTLDMSFLMSLYEFNRWAAWIDKYATTRWTAMPIVQQYAWAFGGDTAPLQHCFVRFPSGYRMSPVSDVLVSISAQVEMMPQDIGEGNNGVGGSPTAPWVPDDDWIIARDPINPSPDWVIARTPTNPAIDWVLSETPVDHEI